ncbi:MAG: PAS domain-containing protein [Lysobacterales bacterium]
MRKRQGDRRLASVGKPGSIHDLLKLYNLALAIRGGGDPHTICLDFVSETVRQLKISYGAVWLIEPGEKLERGEFVLFASYPRARDGLDRVTSDHAMPRAIAQGRPVRMTCSNPDFASITVEPSIQKGVQVIFRLDGVGLLKFYCTDADGIPESEVNQLRRVIDRFSDTLRGAFATRRLRHEINQRVQAEGKLTRARELTQTLLASSPDLVFLKDLEGRYIQGNEAFRSFWNIGDRPIMGLRPEDIIPQQTLQIIKAQDQQIIQSGQAEFFQELVPRPDGTVAMMEVTRAPVRDDQGELSGIIGIARDSTERFATLAKLETRNRALESITDGVVIITTDCDSTVVYTNDAFSKMTGKSKNELIGRPVREVGLIRADTLIRSQIREAVQSHKPYFLAMDQPRPSGDPFSCELTMAPVLNNDGVSTHYICIVKEVTERERLRRELQQRQKMDTVGRLTSGIAHDFNNMLATILGFSELAEMRAEQAEDSQQQEFLESIRNAANNGRELVSQLLTFSRSVPTEQAQVMQANQAVSNALRMVAPLLPEIIELNYVCNAPLATLAVDNISFERVLVNLCLNARDAMDPSGGTLSVKLEVQSLDGRECAVSLTQLSGDYVTLSVGDTGSAIPDDIIGRIFEPFFTTKRPTQGTGMGLSVVQGIVRANNGYILIESSEGVGTTMTVAFPEPTDIAGPHPYIARPNNIPEPGSLEGRRILVVDDDRQVAAFLRELFQHAGMQVNVAYDGSGGLREFRQHESEVDILLTDQTMPGMSGVDLIREVRALKPQLPCLMLTAYSHFDDASSAAAAGVDRLLRKPTDNKTLLNAVAQFL